MSLLCGFSSVLDALHWPAGTRDLEHHGGSFLEVLILFEQWTGHRLLNEKEIRPHARAHHPISISSVPASEGMEIRQACLFVSSLIRALGKLPGGLGRFLPCTVGRFFQVAASGLGSVCAWACFQAVRVLSSPVPQTSLAGAAAELSDGSPKLRYCTIPFRLLMRMKVSFQLRGSGLPGRHVPGYLLRPDSNAKAMEKVEVRPNPQDSGVRSANLPTSP